VVAKEFARLPDRSQVPREIKVADLAAGVIHGRTVGLPRYYGHLQNAEGRHVLFMEAVERRSARRDNTRLLARALGELAGIPIEQHPGLLHYLQSNPMPELQGRIPEIVQEVCASIDPTGAERVLSLFETCTRRIGDGSHIAAQLPVGLAHADAHHKNVLIDRNRRAILLDLGGLRIAPIGFDLPRIMAHRMFRMTFGSPEFTRYERGAIRAFLAGARSQGCAVKEREARAASALEAFKIVDRCGLRISKFAIDKNLLVGGLDLETAVRRELAVMAMLMQMSLRNLNIYERRSRIAQRRRLRSPIPQPPVGSRPVRVHAPKAF
jgi:Ser/Thr protein kinase RdoA (MazF antagonist)